MAKRGTTKDTDVFLIEKDNSKRIDDLKDVLAQLNTTLAVNTEATKGLKDVVEKEFARQTKGNEDLEQRVDEAERRLGAIDVKLASSGGWVGAMKSAGTLALMPIGFFVAKAFEKLWP
jgi:hypothetical protein